MSFGIANFDSLPYNVKLAFEDLDAYINTFLLKEHNPDGTHKAKAAQVDATLATTEQTEESHHWYRGPWTFGVEGQANGTVDVRPPDIAGGTYNDYACTNIDNAVILRIGLQSASITLTGLRQFANVARLMVLINLESNGTNTITLKHQSTSSSAANRFRLTNSQDVVLTGGQCIWMYYDVGFSRWRPFITPQQSGGLATIGQVNVVNLDITESQLESLGWGSSPISIVTAQGSGTVIVPIALMVKTATSTAYSTAPTYALRWASGSTEPATSVTSTLNAIGTRFSYQQAMIDVNVSIATNDMRNQDLQIGLSADPGTPGTGVATARVTLWYAVATGY